jgi:peptidyl-prolyl cis-trans isomerase B (cyclophilin B)
MFLKRLILIASLALVACLAVVAQNYTPNKGETVVKLAVEGRGNIYIRLNTADAPRTTKHIVALVKSGFYDNQRFFRVERSPRPYIVQFGDPNTKTKEMDDPSIGEGGSGQKTPYEDTRMRNEVGTVGLSTPPKERDGGDSQFYINLSQNRFLDGSYTVFGQVVSGMDVVNKLKLGDRVTKATVTEN